jgi:threonine dehydrogenase-like Zn-dependent dehydrogenase
MTKPVGLDHRTMRVVSCREGGTLTLEERDRPQPGRGELLLALRCAGLCGTDLWKLDGGLTTAGAVLGHEVVGTVVALGAETVGFARGDRVAVAHHVPCGR